MRICLIAMAAASMLSAQGCSTSSQSPIIRTDFKRGEVPAEARKPCERPETLPDRALSAKELTPLWGKDRAALLTCEARRAAAVAAADFVPVPEERPAK
ncbi:hypothetical protein [Brucella tritici]|nr:hypothetical protein [Brucella tritici]